MELSTGRVDLIGNFPVVYFGCLALIFLGPYLLISWEELAVLDNLGLAVSLQ